MIVRERAARIIAEATSTRGDTRPYVLPANICSIVPETLAAAGQAFEYVDIDERSLALDLDAAGTLLRRGRHAGVVYVRAYGSMHEGEAPLEALRTDGGSGVLIIDDRCLCRPDTNAPPPSNADLTLYSTGSRKYLDLGGGGFAIARNETLSGKSADTGWAPYAARISAALPAADAHKSMLNAIYAASLPAEIQLPAPFHEWRFNIMVSEPEELLRELFAAGLFAGRHYAPASPGFARAHAVHRRIVNLFNDGNYDAERAERTTAIVRRHLERSR